MSRRMEVRIHVGPVTDAGSIERTRASIERSRRRLRRADCELDIRVVTRDAPAEDSSAELIAVCTAGDVLDPRFLASAVTLLDARGLRAVIHSDRVLVAGPSPEILRTPDTRARSLGLEALIDGDPWPGARVTSRRVETELGRLEPGHSGSSAAVAAGVPQLTVDAVNIVSDDGLPTGPPALLLDADRVAEGLAALNAAPSDTRTSWESNHPVASGPIRIARRGRRGLLRRARTARAGISDRLARRTALRLLDELVPEHAPLPDSAFATDRGTLRFGEYAPALVNAWQSLGRSTDVILVTPQVSTRSSDQTALQYARVLAGSAAGRVAILTSGEPARTDSGLIPREVLHYPVPDVFRRLEPSLQTAFVEQLAQMTSARHLVVVDRGLHSGLGSTRPRPGGTRVWVHAMPDADALDALAGTTATLLAEGPRAARAISEALGVEPDRVRVHVPPPLPVMPEFDSVTQYTAAHDDLAFDDAHPFRVLWRTSADDAPERAQLLSAFLTSIAASGLPIRVHLHHEVGTDSELPPTVEEAPGLVAGGVFTGGLSIVPSENYHALVVDAGVSDGRTLSIQAMLLGLPIVASAPGDPDLFEDGETAVVVENGDAESLLQGIRMLFDSRDARRGIIRGAYDRARGLVDADPFARAVLRDLGIVPGSAPA